MQRISDLPHQLDRDRLTCRVVIETPAHSRVKFAFDAESGLYEAKKLLPVGLSMPLDFGFVPSTCGGDGDPLDVIVLNEAELAVGCLATVRLIGAIEVEEGALKGGPVNRNDRLVGRLADSRSFAEIDRLEQLGQRYLLELNRFFETYKELSGSTYGLVSVRGPEGAADLIDKWS